MFSFRRVLGAQVIDPLVFCIDPINNDPDQVDQPDLVEPPAACSLFVAEKVLK